jgi:uncharacterized protein YigA (DUF484 family)
MTTREEDVLNFAPHLLKKLQEDLNAAKEAQDEIIKGSRLYWQRVQSVHEAVLLMMDARDFPQAVNLIQEDIARLLGFDVAHLILERLPSDPVDRKASLFRPIPPAFSSAAVFQQESSLIEDPGQLAALFPEQPDAMALALCFTFRIQERRGLLVFGRRDAQYLATGKALEPYVFLTKCMTRLGQAWFAEKMKA